MLINFLIFAFHKPFACISQFRILRHPMPLPSNTSDMTPARHHVITLCSAAPDVVQFMAFIMLCLRLFWLGLQFVRKIGFEYLVAETWIYYSNYKTALKCSKIVQIDSKFFHVHISSQTRRHFRTNYIQSLYKLATVLRYVIDDDNVYSSQAPQQPCQPGMIGHNMYKNLKII